MSSGAKPASTRPRLVDWGWDDRLETALARCEPGLEPARVVLEQPRTLHLLAEDRELVATTSGRLRHQAVLRSDLPAVGDWVAYAPASGARTRTVVEAVLPRRSKLSRKVAGAKTDEQVVAANLDRVFLVMALDNDFNPRRVERFLLMIEEAGVDATVVLNKLDLATDLARQVEAVREVVAGHPVVVIGAKHRQGLEELDPYLESRRTIALVGSSGAGKSTLINRLLGEDRLGTGTVRERDDRGQHTTRHRELVRLPGGALLIDNPGIRELQPWASAEALESTFEDVVELAGRCRFGDCRHESEPGCAVRAAVAAGRLDAGRLASFRSLAGEVAAIGERRRDRNRREAGPRPARRPPSGGSGRRR